MSASSSTPAEPVAKKSDPLAGLRALAGPLMGLVIVLVIFTALIGQKRELGTFYDLRNLQVLVHDNTMVGVAALGALIVIIGGGIDLSVGSVVALVTVVAMKTYQFIYSGPDTILAASLMAIGSGLLVGAVCGLVNGLLICGLRVPPFVTTLGMLSMARGLAIWIAGRQTLTFPAGARPDWVSWLADTRPPSPFLVFYPGFWSLVLLAIATAVLLHRTLLGRYCYAIGSNEATARLCGIAVDRCKITFYALAGLLGGWAGILSFAQVGSGEPSGNVGLELTVIAGVVIGGASLKGGQGTVLGALLGVLILGILENGVSVCDVPVEIKYILIGAIIIANSALSRRRRTEG